MGPTNIALVKLFRADQALREAQERLDAATKNVRIQERKVNDFAEKLKAAQTRHKELAAKAGALDVDVKSRDVHIEKLRTQQQIAKNNKEYQAFLIEINTSKVDRAKIEEDLLKLMEQGETAAKEVADLTTFVEAERAKLATMKTQMSDTVAQLQAEINSLKGPREEAAKSLPPKARDMFNRLSEHHDGEALSSIIKPDRRKEEYVCQACMMDLVTDVYNKLHTRDEMAFCPSCRRILYIPDDLPPELAVNKKKSSSASVPSDSSFPTAVATLREPPRAKGKLGELLAGAQGESVKMAVDADQKPLEFEVVIDGKAAGVYKGKSKENLERVIKFRLEEANLKHEFTLEEVHEDVPHPPGTENAEAPETTEAPAPTDASAPTT